MPEMDRRGAIGEDDLEAAWEGKTAIVQERQSIIGGVWTRFSSKLELSHNCVGIANNEFEEDVDFASDKGGRREMARHSSFSAAWTLRFDGPQG